MILKLRQLWLNHQLTNKAKSGLTRSSRPKF